MMTKMERVGSEVCFFVCIALFLLLVFVSTARRQWCQCSVAVTTPPMPLNDNLQALVSSTPGQNVCFVFSQCFFLLSLSLFSFTGGWAWRNSSKDCWMPVMMQFRVGTEIEE